MKQLLVTSLLVVAGAMAPAVAGDCPQFRGPNRDGVFPETGLLKTWPEGGPEMLWAATGIGKGYSSAVIANGKIYVPGMAEDSTGSIAVLDATGNIERKIPYGKEIVSDEVLGTRSTPTLDGDRLYIESALGVVYCLDLKTDKVLWEVNLFERFNAKNNEWSPAESVLVDGAKVICTPGGPDAGLAALDKMTGATVWTTKGLSDMESYVSPTVAVHNKRRLVLTETSTLVVGADADTGQLLWTVPHKTEWDIHAVTPIYSKGCVYYTAGYASGGGLLELSPDGASVKERWTDKILDCQHHGVVLVDGYLFGTGHRKEQLTCLDMETGKVMWFSKELKQGATIAAEGMLYIYEGPKRGIVSLIKAVPTGFERTGQFTVTEGDGQHWAHPSMANRTLYIRHGDALIAYTIAAN